jgi:geranylgeranyl pyrophosphate synthase
VLELRIGMERFNQQLSDRLSQALRGHPGMVPVVLYLVQANGKTFRAELPSVDGASIELRANLEELLGHDALRV